jgi:hypothetical protein
MLFLKKNENRVKRLEFTKKRHSIQAIYLVYSGD